MDWNNEEVRKCKRSLTLKHLKVREKVRAGAASDGPKALATVEADLETVTDLFNKEEWTMEERFTVVPPMQLNSMVVKLNSGAILLFAPVRVRDEVSQLIEHKKAMFVKISASDAASIVSRLASEPGLRAWERFPGSWSPPPSTLSLFQTCSLAFLRPR